MGEENQIEGFHLLVLKNSKANAMYISEIKHLQ